MDSIQIQNTYKARRQLENCMENHVWDNTNGHLQSVISVGIKTGIISPILRAIITQLRKEINGLNKKCN